MFAFRISWHKLLHAGHLASFTTTMQSCDCNNSHMMSHLIFCVGETVQTWNEDGGESRGYRLSDSWCQIPCSTIHFAAPVTSARRTLITRPRHEERTYLSTSIRMAFQQGNGPRTAEILVIHMMSRQTLLSFCKQPWNSQAAATSLSWESSG